MNHHETPNNWERSLQPDKRSNEMQRLSAKYFHRRKGASPPPKQLSPNL